MMRLIRFFIFVLIFFAIIQTSVIASVEPILSHTLNLYDAGNQVAILQSKLAQDKSVYPSGIISGFYGNLTKQAVLNFQRKYNLNQTGNVDYYTLQKFNNIYGNNSPTTPIPIPIPNKSIFQSFFELITSPFRSLIGLFHNSNSQNNPPQTYTVRPTKTPIPTITLAPTSYYIAPTVDPDPFVNCGISSECGGGSKLLRRSICSQTTCCQIGNNWIFYESKNQCLTDQNNYYSNNNQPPQNNTNTNSNNGYTPPVYTPYPTLAPWPTFDLLPTLTPIPQQQNNSAALGNCINQAYQNYQTAQTYAREAARASGGGDDSLGLQEAANAYSQAQATCHSLYGY